MNHPITIWGVGLSTAILFLSGCGLQSHPLSAVPSYFPRKSVRIASRGLSAWQIRVSPNLSYTAYYSGRGPVGNPVVSLYTKPFGSEQWNFNFSVSSSGSGQTGFTSNSGNAAFTGFAEIVVTWTDGIHSRHGDAVYRISDVKPQI